MILTMKSSYLIFHVLVFFVLLPRPGNSQDSMVLNLNEIPVLSFNNINEFVERPNDVNIAGSALLADLKLLYDSGYRTISPQQLEDYYKGSVSLPVKSFMITFNDGNQGQLEYAVPILEQFNFKAIFFIMTVTIGKKDFLNADQIRTIVEKGHFIGCHTWDHQDVRFLKSKDFHWQLEKPKAYLDSLTKTLVTTFSYPYGAINEKLIPGLKKYGFKLAFQLAEEPAKKFPMYTIRRLDVSGNWSPELVLQKMTTTFKSVTIIRGR